MTFLDRKAVPSQCVRTKKSTLRRARGVQEPHDGERGTGRTGLRETGGPTHPTTWSLRSKRHARLEKAWDCARDPHNALEEELERLKRITDLNPGLKVVWDPRESKLSGEVRGDTIYIYEKDEDEALETLSHEFLDYTITQAIRPLADLVNLLVKAKEDEVYNNKEHVIEKLVNLLRNPAEEIYVRKDTLKDRIQSKIPMLKETAKREEEKMS